ncbi:efflux RND transporter periplasmic adaptor subunit [Pseudomonas sp. LRF_L74]|uniref:efflux RND transporter periplasmic adaptor subunit n=1 Tax=Pseudomonas sp. LRF_L74 TaxID=3369422 RepID=UPI003F624C47
MPSAARIFSRPFLFGSGVLLLLLLILWSQRPVQATWRTAEVERGDIEASVAAVGTLRPLRSVDVGAQVSGQITQLHVEPGDVVEKGQLLAEIDASVLEATVEAGRSELRGLRAQLDDARAQHQLADLQDRRQRQMAKDGSTRLEDVQTAEANLKSAAAQVRQIEAQIDKTSSSLRADDARLGYARIYAPMSGTVTSVDVKEGQTLNATYQTPTVMRIADLSRMTVWTEVSEADIRRVRSGMDVYFTTLGGDRRRWSSKVRQVLPAPQVADPSASTESSSASAMDSSKAVQYTVLFDVENPDRELMPQMTAQVTFVAASRKDVLVAPLEAFRAVSDSHDLFETRVLENDKPVERRVRLGSRDRLAVEVLEGVDGGEHVILGTAASEEQQRRFIW